MGYNRHIPRKFIPEEIVKKYNLQPGRNEAQLEHPRDSMLGWLKTLPKFRLVFPFEEMGTRGYQLFNPNVPRLVINKEDWPYEMNEG